MRCTLAAALFSVLACRPAPTIDAPVARDEALLLVLVDALELQVLDSFEFGPGALHSTSAVSSRSATAALASHLTGLTPAEHGLVSAHDIGAERLTPAVATVAEAFDAAGWNTLFASGLGQHAPQLCGLERGFDEYLYASHPREGPRATLERVLAALPVEASGTPTFACVVLATGAEFGGSSDPAAARFLWSHLGAFAGDAERARAAAAGDAEAWAELYRQYSRRRGSAQSRALSAAVNALQRERFAATLSGLLAEARARFDPVHIVVGELRGSAGDPMNNGCWVLSERAESVEAEAATARIASELAGVDFTPTAPTWEPGIGFRLHWPAQEHAMRLRLVAFEDGVLLDASWSTQPQTVVEATNNGKSLVVHSVAASARSDLNVQLARRGAEILLELSREDGAEFDTAEFDAAKLDIAVVGGDAVSTQSPTPPESDETQAAVPRDRVRYKLNAGMDAEPADGRFALTWLGPPLPPSRVPTREIIDPINALPAHE